jgi:hypothetical protein
VDPDEAAGRFSDEPGWGEEDLKTPSLGSSSTALDAKKAKKLEGT